MNKLKTQKQSTTGVLDTLVLVQLQVRINNGLVFDDFNANKFLSVRRFKRASDTKATTNLEEIIKRKIDKNNKRLSKKKRRRKKELLYQIEFN